MPDPVVRRPCLSYRELGRVVLQTRETVRPSCQHYLGAIHRTPVDYSRGRLPSAHEKLPVPDRAVDVYTQASPFTHLGLD